MNRRFPSLAILILMFALSASAAWAGNAKVQVCHIPPGNPGNFHTITISENALSAHLGHGDLAGACFAHCDTLCSDGNACTIDACDASEHCVSSHPPVNCDDSSLCTIDSCNPATGCANVPKICSDGDPCTVDVCDPVNGSCVAPPVDCGHGECVSTEGEENCECNPGWTGDNCNIPVDPCFDVDCNHGTCVSTEEGGARCECEEGYTGDDCNTVDDPCAGVVCEGDTDPDDCAGSDVCQAGVCMVQILPPGTLCFDVLDALPYTCDGVSPICDAPYI